MFVECDRKGFYEDTWEAIPPNASQPLDRGITVRMYLGKNHPGDKQTRKSRTDFLIFLQITIIDWLSKCQSTVEILVFGAEFSTMCNSVVNLQGICYKLGMMGVSINRGRQL